MVGGGQSFGVQSVAAPCHVLPPVQLDWVVTVQVPLDAQHAPVGCGQGFGEQSVPPPCQLLPPVHAASVVTEQEPECAQQAPVASDRKRVVLGKIQ